MRVAAVAAFLAAVAAAAAQKGAPPAVADKLIAADTAALQKALAGGKPAKNKTDPLKGYALVIAWAAQDNMAGPKAGQMAALRDQAVQVALAVEKKDYPAAAKLADGLKAVKADPAAKAEPVALPGTANPKRIELMSTFSGLNVLKIKPAEADVVAARAVAVASYLKTLPPENAPKWAEFVAALDSAGRELAAEAAKPSPAGISGLLKQLDTACSNCHSVYRR